MTVLADHKVLFFSLWLVLIIIILTPTLYKHTGQLPDLFCQLLTQPYPSSLACIREGRVWTIVFTVIAILAVDFHIFPRRLAKVETYGTGLMDIGIGCFMVSHGVVAREARYPERYTSLPKMSSYVRTIMYSTWKTWPFVMIGVLRLLSVKATDYHEHVTEYGVHWNFFFTIAVVRVSLYFGISSLLLPLPSISLSCPFPILSIPPTLFPAGACHHVAASHLSPSCAASCSGGHLDSLCLPAAALQGRSK